MTAFELIPAIDLRGGRCVRLIQGDYDRETVFGDDPVAMARRWESEGARRLHVVDLDGARAGSPVQMEVVRRVVGAVSVPVQVGGGLRNRATVAAVLAAGAQRAIIGTAALDTLNARELCAEFGEQLIVGLDARDGRVAVQGWLKDSGRGLNELAGALEAAGARRILFTDITRDGTLRGPCLEATRALAAVAALVPYGVEGVVVGRALYTGAVRLSDWPPP